MHNRLYCVIGPSASGKSDYALKLAHELQKANQPAFIISVDVMQMYHGLTIATNKPTMEEREGIPHYFIGHLCPFSQSADSTKHYGTEHNIMKFLPEAISLINELLRREVIPILTGGTLYYIQAILTEFISLTDGGDVPELLEKKEQIRSMPHDELHAHLWSHDADMASRWHPHDYRHIRRSLEVIYEKKYGNSRVESTVPSVRWRDHVILWIDAPMELLHDRIAQRTRQMEMRGLCAEVTLFYLRSVDVSGASPTAFESAIGYKEFSPYLAFLRSQRDIARQRDCSHSRRQKSHDSTAEAMVLWNRCLDDLKHKTRKYCTKQNRWIHNKLLGHRDLIVFRVAPWKLPDESALTLYPKEIREIFQSTHAAMEHHPKRVHVVPRSTEMNHIRFCSLCTKYLENEAQLFAHESSRQHRKNLSKRTAVESPQII